MKEAHWLLFKMDYFPIFSEKPDLQAHPLPETMKTPAVLG